MVVCLELFPVSTGLRTLTTRYTDNSGIAQSLSPGTASVFVYPDTRETNHMPSVSRKPGDNTAFSTAPALGTHDRRPQTWLEKLASASHCTM